MKISLYSICKLSQKARLKGAWIPAVLIAVFLIGNYLPEAQSQTITTPSSRKHRDDGNSNVVAEVGVKVEALVNRNPVPINIRNSKTVFDPKYDWDEHWRAWRAIHSLVKDTESAWPELVKHLTDDRYCTCFGVDSGDTIIVTVGEMCAMIIGRTLSVAYLNEFDQKPYKMYARYKIPAFGQDGKKLKGWCDKRRNKKLYELQMEACEWMTKELDKSEIFAKWEPAYRNTIKDKIRSKIEALRESKKATQFGGFSSEEYRAVNPP